MTPCWRPVTANSRLESARLSRRSTRRDRALLRLEQRGAVAEAVAAALASAAWWLGGEQPASRTPPASAACLYNAALILRPVRRQNPFCLARGWALAAVPPPVVRLCCPWCSRISWRDAASKRMLPQAGLQETWLQTLSGPLPAPGVAGGWWAEWCSAGRPAVLLEGRQVEPAAGGWILAAGCERQVIWLPFHRDQDRGLLCRLQPKGLVPDGLLSEAKSARIDQPCCCFRPVQWRWAGGGDAPAWPDSGRARRPPPACASVRRGGCPAGAIDCPCQDLTRL